MVNHIGLFYLIDDNDYILLEEFNDIYSPQSKQYIFNNNKLYVLKSAAVVFEYTLDKEKISTKELNFKYDNSFIYEFLSVNDNYISIEAAPANFGEDREHYKLECNFKTLDCEKLPLE